MASREGNGRSITLIGILSRKETPAMINCILGAFDLHLLY